ncbi:MAG: FHA domain-containing protein [Anaerolineaceae bacterium]|nr:FHA domain-containing protein [Anaerolineaceae bacterium]
MTAQLRPMTTCQQCGQENAEGYTVCVKCGSASPLSAPQSQPAQQVSYAIKFLVEGEELPLSLIPSQRAIMGRQAPFMLQLPDVDLTSYSAAEHGISRVHAVIDCSRTGLQITDLDSRNGTFVNGEKLYPYNAHVLRHGDTLRLGSMSLEVIVKVDRRMPVEAAPAPARSIPAELQPKVTRLLSLAGQLNGNLVSPVPPQNPGNSSSTLNKAS